MSSDEAAAPQKATEPQAQSFVSWHASAAGLAERHAATGDGAASEPPPDDPPFAIAASADDDITITLGGDKRKCKDSRIVAHHDLFLSSSAP